jgi:hypothetical protein
MATAGSIRSLCNARSRDSRSALVRAREPAVAGAVYHEDRSKLLDFGHGRALQFHKKGLSRRESLKAVGEKQQRLF